MKIQTIPPSAYLYSLVGQSDHQTVKHTRGREIIVSIPSLPILNGDSERKINEHDRYHNKTNLNGHWHDHEHSTILERATTTYQCSERKIPLWQFDNEFYSPEK